MQQLIERRVDIRRESVQRDQMNEYILIRRLKKKIDKEQKKKQNNEKQRKKT